MIMPFSVKNIFAETKIAAGAEQFAALFENSSVRVERIVSRAHRSPPGFWYDQGEDEWVIVLRGSAALEFAAGDIIEMKEGDYLVIPRGTRHRVARTDENTVWLALHLS